MSKRTSKKNKKRNNENKKFNKVKSLHLQDNVKVDPAQVSPVKFQHFWTKESHRLTPEERNILQRRLTTDYEKLKKIAIQDCKDRLGFDINTDYALDELPVNIKRLPMCYLEQTESMPLSLENFNRIMGSPKQKVVSFDFVSTKGKETRHESITYYCCMVEGKPVLLALCTRQADLSDENNHSMNSVSVFIMIRGTEPLLVGRFDTKPASAHPNKLEKDGSIPFGKSFVKGPHEHLYSEKMAVVYPFRRFVAHYDAADRTYFKKFSDAVLFMKNRYKFQDKEFDNSDNIFVNIPKNHLPQTKENDIIKE